MSAIDAYGNFDLPEEKSTIEVVEDPVKFVISCYEMFLKTVSKDIQIEDIDLDDVDNSDKICGEAINIFNGKSSLKMDFKQANKVLRILADEFNSHKNKYHLIIGLFLSALQNSTSIDALFVDKISYQQDLGYKLKKNKILVTGPEITGRYLGYKSEGSIINLGDCKIMGQDSSGLCINAKDTKMLGTYQSGGIFINLGKTNQIIENTPQTISINKGNIGCTTYEKYAISIKTSKCLKDLNHLLDKKLSEINFLKAGTGSYASKRFYSFNWNKFVDEVSGIAKRIQQKYYENGAK